MHSSHIHCTQRTGSAARLEAQEAIVNKDTVEALANHFVHQRCRDCAVHTAAERADHVLVRRHLQIRACRDVLIVERACSDVATTDGRTVIITTVALSYAAPQAHYLCACPTQPARPKEQAMPWFSTAVL